MKTTLTVNLTSKTAQLGGSGWTPPPLTFNEDLTLALRFQRTVGSSAVDYYPTVHSLTASLGNIDARPVGGKTKLKIGPDAQSGANTTDWLEFNVTASDLKAKINALTAIVEAYGSVNCWSADDSLFLLFGDGTEEIALTLVDNRLWPVTFGKVGAYLRDGRWIHELRLVQSPAAFTDASAVVVPAGPSITEVQEGGSSGEIAWNEVQALYVPPDFRGAYQLKRDFKRTALLSTADGPDEIKAALAVFGDGFNVSNPLDNTANIEFIGDFAGASQALFDIVIDNAPPGDVVFTLTLDRAELLAMLRQLPTLTLPLEVRMKISDSEDATVREVVAFTVPVTVNRPVAFPELATTPQIDWLRPPSPKNYIPFNASQVITGQQYYQAVLGDAVHTSFVVAHGLATEAVFVFGRINTDGGRQLINGKAGDTNADFAVTIDSANQVTITALNGVVPTLNQWAFFVMSAQTVAAFADDLTLEIGQVNGLETALEDIGARLTTIEDLLPSAPPSIGSSSSSEVLTITIPDHSEALPYNSTTRVGALLPAIHKAIGDVTNGSFPLTEPGTAGSVVKNNTGSPVLIPGGFGRDESYVADQGYVGSDGRIWYIVNRVGSSNSFYPADFERTLFVLDCNDAMLSAGSVLTLNFDLALQLLKANTRAQWLLVVELGSFPQDTSPATTAANLQNVTWNTASPMLSQRLILSDVLVKGTFGVAVSRDKAGTTITAQRNLYGTLTGGATAPDDANFALRARLIQFDTENSVTKAKGAASYALSNCLAKIVKS